MSIELVMPYNYLVLCIPFSWCTVDNKCLLKERFCREAQLGQEWFRGGRKMQPSWCACPPSPLQGRPQSPQDARVSSLNGCRQVQADLPGTLAQPESWSEQNHRQEGLAAGGGLWSTGRPLGRCPGPGGMGLSPWVSGRLQVAQDLVSQSVCHREATQLA